MFGKIIAVPMMPGDFVADFVGIPELKKIFREFEYYAQAGISLAGDLTNDDIKLLKQARNIVKVVIAGLTESINFFRNNKDCTGDIRKLSEERKKLYAGLALLNTILSKNDV